LLLRSSPIEAPYDFSGFADRSIVVALFSGCKLGGEFSGCKTPIFRQEFSMFDI
jgi:hypothetical protein